MASRDDWYRRTTWSDADQRDFRKRLHRSRGLDSKAQYLRIQASYLADAGRHAAALSLLEELLTECPVKLQLAQAYLQKAEALLALGDTPQAIVAFRASLDAERAFSGVRTQCWLVYAYFVTTQRFYDLFLEAQAVLEEFDTDGQRSLPIQQYQYATSMALIAEHRGDTCSAHEWATEALRAADARESGFPYHPELGLVSKEDAQIIERLRHLRDAG